MSEVYLRQIASAQASAMPESCVGCCELIVSRPEEAWLTKIVLVAWSQKNKNPQANSHSP